MQYPRRVPPVYIRVQHATYNIQRGRGKGGEVEEKKKKKKKKKNKREWVSTKTARRISTTVVQYLGNLGETKLRENAVLARYNTHNMFMKVRVLFLY